MFADYFLNFWFCTSINFRNEKKVGLFFSTFRSLAVAFRWHTHYIFRNRFFVLPVTYAPFILHYTIYGYNSELIRSNVWRSCVFISFLELSVSARLFSLSLSLCVCFYLFFIHSYILHCVHLNGVVYWVSFGLFSYNSTHVLSLLSCDVAFFCRWMLPKDVCLIRRNPCFSSNWLRQNTKMQKWCLCILFWTKFEA